MLKPRAIGTSPMPRLLLLLLLLLLLYYTASARSASTRYSSPCTCRWWLSVGRQPGRPMPFNKHSTVSPVEQQIAECSGSWPGRGGGWASEDFSCTWKMISSGCKNWIGRNSVNPLMGIDNYNATSNNTSWYTGRMGGLLQFHFYFHFTTASVPITVLLYNGPLLCGFNVPIKGLSVKR